MTCTNPQQPSYEKSTRPLQSSWNTRNRETNLIATIVSKSCEKHIVHSEKLILPGLQHKKKTPRETSRQLKCRHRACSEYSKSISVRVAKARCPELWSKSEEDKQWLSEIVVLWIGSWQSKCMPPDTRNNQVKWIWLEQQLEVTMAQRVDCNISGQHKNKDRTKKTREHPLDRSEHWRTVKKKKKMTGLGYK